MCMICICTHIHTYLFLIGVGMKEKPIQGDFDPVLGDLRLSIPLLLMCSIAVGNYCVGDKTFTMFQMLSKEQFLGAMVGFLSYFITILYQEVGKVLTFEDLVGFLPGSIAMGLRMSKVKKEVSEIEEYRRIIFITGPRIAGRRSITEGLIDRLRYDNPKYQLKKIVPKFVGIKLLTTNMDVVDRFPAMYSRLPSGIMSDLKESRSVFLETFDYDIFQPSWDIALTYEELYACTSAESIGVLQGPPELLDSLSTLTGFRVTPIWVSMQTKEQFIQRAIGSVQQEISRLATDGGVSNEELVEKGSAEVTRFVNDAARDINYYMQKAPLFEYTILAETSEEDALDEVESVVRAST